MKKDKSSKEQEVNQEINKKENSSKEEKKSDKKAPSLEEIIAIAEEKCLEYKDMAQRIQAEFDNYRKRTQEELKTIRYEGSNCVLREILQIDDNFDRAVEALKDSVEKEGVLLIKRQLKALLEKFEVKEIEALGAKFNPSLHNAVMQVEEEGKENEVIEVLQKGYSRGNCVLRYAMVKVAK